MTKRDQGGSYKTNPSNSLVSSYLLAAGLTCSWGVVNANTVQLEEVIVTAQKREQSLQDVPLSVAVIAGENLEDRNENEISAIAKFSPSFTFQEGPNNGFKSLQVRGVGTLTLSKGVDQSVSVVVDGVVATGAATSLLDMHDVSRVEILRGPQGMLFGKNASAGVLNITTNRPTKEFEAGIAGSYADEEEIKFGGYISGGLTDSISGRLAISSTTRDAFIENTYPGGKDFSDRDQQNLRGKLAFEITDNLDAMVTLNRIESETNCCIQNAISTVPGSIADGVPAGDEEDTVLENDDDSFYETEVDDAIFELNYQMGDYTLTSITAYAETYEESSYNSFAVPLTVFPRNDATTEVEQITQEFRITSTAADNFVYQLGLYYFTKDLAYDTLLAVDAVLGGAPVPGFLFITSRTLANVDWESYALFGQGTLDLSDKARLTVGLRLNHEDVDMDVAVTSGKEFFPNVPPVTISPILGEVEQNKSDDSVSWRVIGEYDIAKDVMLYGSVARGYKGPGANTIRDVVVANEEPIVDPEIPTNYEIGVKSRLFDGRAVLNATLFFSEFEDFQTSLAIPNSAPPAFFLSNAESLESKGLEMEFSAQVTQNLFIGGALAYVDAEFTDYKGAPCYSQQTEMEGCIDGAQDLSGKRMANSPEWSYSLNARYDFPLESFPFSGFVAGSYRWQDEVQYQTNNNPRSLGDSYGVADMSFGIEAEDGRYQVQFFVKNLFDEFFVAVLNGESQLLGIDNGHIIGYDYERRIGVSARINF